MSGAGAELERLVAQAGALEAGPVGEPGVTASSGSRQGLAFTPGALYTAVLALLVLLVSKLVVALTSAGTVVGIPVGLIAAVGALAGTIGGPVASYAVGKELMSFSEKRCAVLLAAAQ